MKSLRSTAVGSGPLRVERRRREARRDIFTNPELVTTRRSILGPPAEGQPGPSGDDDDDGYLVSLKAVQSCVVRKVEGLQTVVPTIIYVCHIFKFFSYF